MDRNGDMIGSFGASSLQCGLCLEQYDLDKKMPMLLCLNIHTICLDCAKKNKTLVCPFCKRPYVLNQLVPNRYMVQSIKRVVKAQVKEDQKQKGVKKMQIQKQVKIQEKKQKQVQKPKQIVKILRVQKIQEKKVEQKNKEKQQKYMPYNYQNYQNQRNIRKIQNNLNNSQIKSKESSFHKSKEYIKISNSKNNDQVFNQYQRKTQKQQYNQNQNQNQKNYNENYNNYDNYWKQSIEKNWKQENLYKNQDQYEKNLIFKQKNLNQNQEKQKKQLKVQNFINNFQRHKQPHPNGCIFTCVSVNCKFVIWICFFIFTSLMFFIYWVGNPPNYRDSTIMIVFTIISILSMVCMCYYCCKVCSTPHNKPQANMRQKLDQNNFERYKKFYNEYPKQY